MFGRLQNDFVDCECGLLVCLMCRIAGDCFSFVVCGGFDCLLWILQ